MSKALEHNTYESLVKEVENYGLDAEYSLEIDEDGSFHYLTLEVDDPGFPETEEVSLDDMVLLGNYLDARSISELDNEDVYKISVPKY